VTKAPPPTARLRIKVVPGSSRDEVVGRLGDALTIKVTAPPQKGRPNEAVVALLADRLGLSAALVAVVGGHSSPSKVIAITGMDDQAIRNALGKAGRSAGHEQGRSAAARAVRPGASRSGEAYASRTSRENSEGVR
jgi:hypothetical protein